MQQSMKKLLYAGFFIIVFALTVWSVFNGADLEKMLTYLKSTDPSFIIPSILCVISFILGESVIFYYLFRTLGIHSQFSHCCLYSFIGFFYSCITPSASGGQPMQLIAMRKDLLPVAPCTVVMAIVAITYKMVLVLLGGLILIIRPPQVMLYLENVQGIMYLGLVLNVIFIAVLLLLVFHPNAVRSLATRTLSLINRIHPLRDISKQEQRLERLIAQYNGTADFYRTHKGIIVNVLLITVLQRILLFLVTWFVYLSFGLTDHTMPTIVTLQGMISVAVDMLPLPGGLGISETLFLEIFTPVFGEALALSGMVLSRGIAFYTQLLISAALTIVAAFVIKDRRKETTGNGI